MRRRTFGDGPSARGVGKVAAEAEDGSFRKLATAWEARLYLRNSMSCSLRRLPELTVLENATGCFPLLLAGATSLRLVKEPSS